MFQRLLILWQPPSTSRCLIGLALGLVLCPGLCSAKLPKRLIIGLDGVAYRDMRVL